MQRITSLLLLILVLIGISYAGTRYLTSKKTISTDNAYTSGDIVTISSQLNDMIMWVGAEEGDYVEAGQKIIVLDGGSAQNEFSRAKSELARTVQEVAALRQKVQRRKAEVKQWQVSYRLARNEAQRRQKLAAKGMVSKEERDVAVLRAEEVAASLTTAEERLGEAVIKAGTGEIADHPQVRAAAAWVRGKYAHVKKSVIVAPVSGHIAKRFVGPGDVIAVGKPLFQLVQLDKVWVEANFKETKLKHLRAGQPVTIHSDLYGDDVLYHGKVLGIGSGTGAAFSLLPPQNATGNWLKIIQRVPVRIAFTSIESHVDPGSTEISNAGSINTESSTIESIRSHPLPIGTSLSVVIDTRNRDGERLPLIPGTHQEQVYEVYQYWREGAAEVANKIIAENLPDRSARHSASP